MSSLHDHLPFLDDLSPEERTTLRAAMQEDAALAEAARQWQRVRAAVREQLNQDVPDRRLCVLYGLDAAGRAEALSPDEQQELAATRRQFEDVLRAHPSLADVVQDVHNACADFDAAWSEHLESTGHKALHTAPDRIAVRPYRQRVLYRWGWRALAVAAVLIFGVVSVLILQRDASMQTIEVAEGTTRIVELADGSTVRLLGGATLTYAALGEATTFDRRVRLEGRAFFDIVPDQQGFTVETPTAITTALGTSFGIQADDEQMEVVLASGRIAVAPREARDRVVVLEPGQMSRVARNALPTTPAPVNLTEALEWTGLFLFRATPVSEVTRRLAEHFDVTITAPSVLEDEGFTGTFTPEQSVEDILDVLATALGAHAEGDAEKGFRLRVDRE